MKHRLLAIAILALVPPAFALDGDPRMHDPSTVVPHDGKFYSYGTGNGLPISVSDDGWTWRRAGTLMQAPGRTSWSGSRLARRRQHLGSPTPPMNCVRCPKGAQL